MRAAFGAFVSKVVKDICDYLTVDANIGVPLEASMYNDENHTRNNTGGNTGFGNNIKSALDTLRSLRVGFYFDPPHNNLDSDRASL